MIIQSIKICGHRCFKKGWSGFETFKPINVIIGRNNTGKSHLLDLAELLCKPDIRQSGWSLLCTGSLDEASLKKEFGEGTTGGALYGDYWHNHGIFFKDVGVAWEIDASQQIKNIKFQEGFDLAKTANRFDKLSESQQNARIFEVGQVITAAKSPFNGKIFRRILAERDIFPYTADKGLGLSPNGDGATNIIRRYITSAVEELSRDLIQKTLLYALNEIFGSDGNFTEIQVKQHDDNKHSNFQEGFWEVFIAQEKKGLIALSKSGSGLKTVLLVLLNLLVIPDIEKKKKSAYIYAFEELENNLHPALLRRLFQYIENHMLREGAHVFLTTHSSTALDYFGVSENAQITHVSHDGESAHAYTVSAHFDKLGVISELGAKPSDLLQANGIIWVEGPSDCIYLNRWIDLFSKGKLQEGRDYQCAFYGGSLLARTQFASPEEAEAELVNLFRVNSNIIVICDSDKTSRKCPLKNRVLRIESQVKKIPKAHLWITAVKEIENYLPGDVVKKALSALYPLKEGAKPKDPIIFKDPDRFESFFPCTKPSRPSYWEKWAKRKSYDKTELAVTASPHMTMEGLMSRFDLANQITNIVKTIESWKR